SCVTASSLKTHLSQHRWQLRRRNFDEPPTAGSWLERRSAYRVARIPGGTGEVLIRHRLGGDWSRGAERRTRLHRILPEDADSTGSYHPGGRCIGSHVPSALRKGAPGPECTSRDRAHPGHRNGFDGLDVVGSDSAAGIAEGRRSFAVPLLWRIQAPS